MPNCNSRWLILSLVSLILLSGLLSATSATTADAMTDAAIQAAAIDRLEAKAELSGDLHVIVELRTAALPAVEAPSEAGHDTQRAQRQFADRARFVARAQDRLAAAVADRPTRLNRYRYLPLATLHADRDTIRRLRSLPDVLSVTEDRPHEPLLKYSVPRIGGGLAYAQGWTGAGQAVAVIDTGVQTSHPYFAGRVLNDAEACYSGAYLSNVTTLCPNLPPDCPGILTSNGGYPSHTACGADAGVQCTGHGSCWHGTHVAGIVLGNNSTYRGVAPGANLIPIQVFVIQGSSLIAYDSDIIAGLEHVLSLSQAGTQIAAVNLSLGGDTYTSVRDCNLDSAPTKTAIDALRAAGIATVVAAGNNGNPTAISTPGCISSAVSVGATDNSDAIPYFSNLASALTLFAPGYNIVSSVPTNTIGGASGTSMATPHVAGAFAVLRQKAAQNLLTPSVDNLVAALRLSGTPITYGSNAYSTPRIQIDQALNLIKLPLPVELIMDSETAASGVTTMSGSFTSVADTNAYGGSALRGASTSQANALRFAPTLAPGYFDVYAWWPVLKGNASQAQATISSDAGLKTLVMDQGQGGGWSRVGTFSFGHASLPVSVALSDSGGTSHVLADALRFVSREVDPISITTASLAPATFNDSYTATVQAGGGLGAYTWSIISGALPGGLVLGASTGEITGLPARVGTFRFVVEARDIAGGVGSQNLSLVVAVLTPPPDLVIDNGQAGTQVVAGTWTPWSNDPPQTYGANFLAGMSSGVDIYRYTPTIVRTGQYRVSARWITYPNRSTKAVYDITHAVGTTTVTTDQRVNGGQWRELGVFTFTAGTGGFVEVSDRNGPYVIADAMMFQYVGEAPGQPAPAIDTNALVDATQGTSYTALLQSTGGTSPYLWSITTGVLPEGLTLAPTTGAISGTPTQAGVFAFTAQVVDAAGRSTSKALSITVLALPPPPDIVLDNGNAGTQTIAGTWTVWSNDPAQTYGANFLAGMSSGVDIYRYTPTIVRTGQYRVSARWITYPNRSTKAVYDITHAVGTTTVTTDQRVNGGQWRELGVFTFTAGTSGFVEVSDRNGPYVIADAIMLQYLAE